MTELLLAIKNNIRILVSIMLTSITFVIQAQNKTEFIKNYTFFGALSSYNYYSKGKTFYGVDDSPVKVQNINFGSYSLGGIFQIYKTNNFIFQAGFRLRHIVELREFRIDKDQFEQPTINYHWFTYSDFGDNILDLPLRIEYIFLKKLFFYTSFVPGYYKQYKGSEENIISGIDIYSEYYERYDSFHFSLEGGLGTYLTTKFILIQPYIYYSKSFNNMWEGNLTITGIKNRNYTKILGKFNQSGDYIGFGLNIYPKKFW